MNESPTHKIRSTNMDIMGPNGDTILMIWTRNDWVKVHDGLERGPRMRGIYRKKPAQKREKDLGTLIFLKG